MSTERPKSARTRRRPSAAGSALPKTRVELLTLHAAARARREAAALGSDDYRSAAEEVARIEVAINRLEDPDL